MTDVLRLLAIAGATLLAAALVQRQVDRGRARALDRAAGALDLVPVGSAANDDRTLGDRATLERDLPFLAPYPPSEVRVWNGTHRGAETVLVALRPRTGPLLGYTLLARRTPSWSARAVVRPEGLPGEPVAGRDPDPRRAAALASPALLTALDPARAFVHVEGPWRVVGTPEPATSATVERLAGLASRLPDLVPEPDEFAGGLEWNV